VSGRTRKYGWSGFLTSCLGRIECHDSWRIEIEALGREIDYDEFEDLPGIHRDFLKSRVELLRAQKLKGQELFLPRPNLGALMLQSESVLFPRQKYDDISQVTVYLMVAAALQRARDHRSPNGDDLDEDMCFHGSPFIVSVLDPDMFSRFNDGVLQAAFLRACAPDELNYAGHQFISRHMKDILIAIFDHCESDAGEAAFEFLLALATKRLRINDEHFEKVLESIERQPILLAFWKVLKSEPVI
jgi:hypothetical protein